MGINMFGVGMEEHNSWQAYNSINRGRNMFYKAAH